MPDEAQGLIAYPIQPTFIVVRELYFVSYRPPSADDRIDESSVHITQSAGPFDEQTRRVQVTLKAEFGMKRDEESPPPFSARVVVTGEFNISEAFPKEKITLWIGTNAAFVLYPYLRERMHYITAQGGYPPIMLPLLQIPTMKIEGGMFGVPAKSVAKLGGAVPQEKIERS
jgi:preprotein translocase subunit SecB